MKSLGNAKNAADIMIVMNNHNNGRLTIMTAKELSLSGQQLNGKQVSIISNVDAKDLETFDHLVIENQDSMSTKASNLTQIEMLSPELEFV